MVRHFPLADAFVRSGGSAFHGGAQPGCIRAHLQRDRHPPRAVCARRRTALPGAFAPVSVAPRPPQRRAIGGVRTQDQLGRFESPRAELRPASHRQIEFNSRFCRGSARQESLFR